MKYLLSIGFISSTLFMSAFAATGSDATPDGSTVLVEIDGAKLTLADFERKRPAGLFQARNAFYDAERKALEEFVADYLLERQAQKENCTVAELLDRHVNSKIEKDPPEEALRVYYEGVDTTEPYEAVRGQILDSIRQRRILKVKTAYLQSLRKQTTLTVRLTPPRAQVGLKDTPVRGPQNAAVTVIEYADYECPACQQTQPGLDRLESEYKGKVAFAYKDVPLPMHSHAQKAAEASHCAGAQGKYWEYHDMLFATKQLDVAQLKQHARLLKLDGAAFDKCLDSSQQADLVKAQLTEGQTFGLQGTPSFFINGRFFNGGLTYEQLKAVVEDELGASRLKETAKR